MKWKRILTIGPLLAACCCPAVLLAGEGVVALQTADPSCRDSSTDVYVDCGNGTITDNRTGLVWLREADCLGIGVDFDTAMEFAAGLADLPDGSSAATHDCGLSDGSSPGEWRLPSVAEWEAMVADAAVLGCSPTITRLSGDSCWTGVTCTQIPGGPQVCTQFSQVLAESYWSATTSVIAPLGAWTLDLVDGFTGFGNKANIKRVWPVRGGQ